MESVQNTELIVLTGGPGAGKTAVLEFVKKTLCEHVVVFPEAASILFNGGFWRFESLTAKKALQRAIFHVQQEMQNLVVAEKKWHVGLCDRGTLDGLAYWPNAETSFLQDLGTTIPHEYTKYKAVIHLRTPSIAQGYNYQNPVRIESVEMAAQIDARIHDIWKNHPHYHVIESQADFMTKVNLAVQCIKTYLPGCCPPSFSQDACQIKPQGNKT